LDAVHLEFPALMLRLAGEDLDEALGAEFITVAAPFGAEHSHVLSAAVPLCRPP